MRKAPSTDSPDSTPLALASNTPPSPTRWKPPATPTNSFSSPQSQSQPQPAPPVQITLGGLPQGLVAPTPPIPKPEGKKYPKEFLVALYDPKRAKPEGMEGMESVVQEMMEDRQQSDHRRPYPPRSTRSFSSRPFSEDSSPRRGEDLWDTPAVSGSGGSFGDGAFRMDSSGGGGGRERPWAREKRTDGVPASASDSFSRAPMPSTTSSAAAIPSNLAPPPEQIDELFARLPLPSGVGSAFLPPSSQPGAIGSGTQTGLGLGLGSVGLSSAGAMGTPASVLGTASGFSAGTLGGLGGLPGHGGAAVLGGNPALAGLGLSNPASALPLAAPNLGLDVGSFGLGLGAGIGGAAGMPMARPQAVVEPPKWVYRDPQGQVQGPFSHLEMQEWYSNGYFEPSLPVRHVDDPTFEALGSFLARWPGLTPFKDEAADYVRRKEASQLQQQQPGFGAFGWPGQTQQAPQQQAAQLAQQNAALQEIAALAASGALSLSPQALVLLLQQLQAQQTVIERMAQQGQLAGTMGQLGVGAGGLGAVGGLGIGGLPQVPQVPLMPGILTGGSGGGFSLFGEGTGAVDATRREDQIQLQPEAVPERPVAEVVPEASEAPAPPAPEQLEPEPIAAPALLPAADAPEEPIATDVAPAEEVFVSEPIVADKEKKKKDKKKDGMGKQAVATVDAELADAAAAEALLKAEEAANEAARKAAWEQKQAAPTTPSLREIQEMEEREREKQRKRKEQATKTALAEEIARAQAEQEAVAKIQQATAAWSAPKGKKLSMQEIMAEEERKERERKAKLEAQRAAAVQAAPPGIGESWSATRRFADAVGNSPSASPAPAWGGMKPMSVPAGSPVKPSGIAVVAVTGPIVRPPAAAPAPISTAQASPSDGQDSWHTVGARGSTQSPTVARGLSSPSPVPASSTPGKVSSFSGKDKGPSDDFMKWCRSALKPVVAGGPVNADDFVSMLLSFPMNDTSTITMVCEDTLGFTTAIDPRKFAAEFISRRRADAGIGPAPKSGTGLEGFETPNSFVTVKGAGKKGKAKK